MTPTDLPDPVVPAIIRCGMRDRSATTGAPPMSLPSASVSRPGFFCTSSEARISRQEHRLALGVRHLDADDVAARHGGDAHRGHRQAARHVVRQPDHPGAANAGRRLQLVQRHHRARADLHDAALHAVVRQHGLQQSGIGLQRLLARPGRWRAPAPASAGTATETASRPPAAAGSPVAAAAVAAAGRVVRATTGGGSIHRRHQPSRGRWLAPHDSGPHRGTNSRSQRQRPRIGEPHASVATPADTLGGRPRPAARHSLGRQAKRQQSQRPASASPSSTQQRADRTQHAVPGSETDRGQQLADRAAQPGHRRPGERRRRRQAGKHRSQHRQRGQHRAPAARPCSQARDARRSAMPRPASPAPAAPPLPRSLAAAGPPAPRRPARPDWWHGARSRCSAMGRAGRSRQRHQQREAQQPQHQPGQLTPNAARTLHGWWARRGGVSQRSWRSPCESGPL